MEYAPHGDLGSFIRHHKSVFDQKLVRTFFHHLISGLEYLHSNGIYHLDIKPSNLLISSDLKLKIADFDIAIKKSDSFKSLGGGTKNFRAPELRNNTGTNGAAADIYSSAITLFFMMTKGTNPYSEEEIRVSIPNMYSLMLEKPSEFWKAYGELREMDSNLFDDDFKELFEAMINKDSDYRISIEGVKRMTWYQKPVYSENEVKRMFTRT